MLLLWPHVHQGEENLSSAAETYFQCFEASLLFLQGSLLFSLVHFGERHAGVGQGRDSTGEGASSSSRDKQEKKIKNYFKIQVSYNLTSMHNAF